MESLISAESGHWQWTKLFSMLAAKLVSRRFRLGRPYGFCRAVGEPSPVTLLGTYLAEVCGDSVRTAPRRPAAVTSSIASVSNCLR
jgi:hypothetical protein